MLSVKSDFVRRPTVISSSEEVPIDGGVRLLCALLKFGFTVSFNQFKKIFSSKFILTRLFSTYSSSG